MAALMPAYGGATPACPLTETIVIVRLRCVIRTCANVSGQWWTRPVSKRWISGDLPSMGAN